MARAVVVDHVFIRMRKLEESRRFYEAALAPLGFGIPYSYEGGCSLGIEGADGGAEDFWNLAGNTPSINVYVAFSATDREAVDAFHHAALEAGAKRRSRAPPRVPSRLLRRLRLRPRRQQRRGGAQLPHRDSGLTLDSSRYISFAREEWSRLRAATPLDLDEWDLATLRGLNEEVFLDEVIEVYLPLSRLLNLYVAATQNLYRVTDTFLGKPTSKVPYVIGIAGSVAVGKSTTARILRALLARWPDHPEVDLVTTDGFLYPNEVLEERGLMSRKGFPESYDVRRLARFVSDVKSGKPEVAAPVYSHLAYDVLPGEAKLVRQPDIMILEGLNVLQAENGGKRDNPGAFVSDYFDFSIYVDAEDTDLERWYVDRFLTLRDTVFQHKASYFNRYAALSTEEAKKVARGIWVEINGPNLAQNIKPTRERAHLILKKGPDHSVKSVKLRKL